MKRRLWHAFGVAIIVSLCQGLLTSCASSEDEAAAEEVVEGEGQGNNEEQASAEENTGQGEETANAEQTTEGNDVTADTGEQGVATDGVEDPAGGEQIADAGAGGQGNLQEIIDEMNQSGETPPDAQPVAEGPPADGAAVPAGDAGSPPSNAAPTTQAPPASSQQSAPSTPSPAGLPEMGSKMAYIVQKGDTLAKIAGKIYGDASKWSEIQSFTNLSNPRLIYPGDVVYYQLNDQTVAFASAYESLPRSEVQVQQGDTLSIIASRVLGSSSNWKLIWRQNDGISDPDQLTAGTTLYYIAPGALSAAVNELKTQIAETKKNVFRVIAEKKINNTTTLENKIEKSSEEINSTDFEIENDFVETFKNNKIDRV